MIVQVIMAIAIAVDLAGHLAFLLNGTFRDPTSHALQDDTCFGLGWDAAFAHNATATISPSHTYQFVTCPAGHSVNYCVGWIAAQAPDYNSCDPINPSAVPCTYGSADYQNGQQDGSDKADADWAHKGVSGYDDTPPKIPGHPGNTSNDPSDVEYNQGWRDGYSDRWNDLIG